MILDILLSAENGSEPEAAAASGIFFCNRLFFLLLSLVGSSIDNGISGLCGQPIDPVIKLSAAWIIIPTMVKPTMAV